MSQEQACSTSPWRGLHRVCRLCGHSLCLHDGQIWVGVIAAFVIAILLNCLFYLFTVKLKGNLSVVGSGINLMAACIPACLLQALYRTRSNLVASSIIDPANMMIDVPVLRSIPILSDIF